MKCWIEAELLILPTRSVGIIQEDCLIRLVQLHRNLARKQYFVSDLNSKVQAKFDDEESLEGEILQSPIPQNIIDKLVDEHEHTSYLVKGAEGVSTTFYLERFLMEGCAIQHIPPSGNPHSREQTARSGRRERIKVQD